MILWDYVSEHLPHIQDPIKYRKTYTLQLKKIGIITVITGG